jgi:3-hydroxyacyl-CoA dehydrogenase
LNEAINMTGSTWSLAERKQGQRPVASNQSASIWAIGDDVACLELHSKMNSIDDFVLEMMTIAARLRERGFAALVVGNDGRNFSVGVNLAYVVSLIEARRWSVLEAFVRYGQAAMTALKMSPLPVVSAVAGHALGGGCEIALHSDAIQAHTETYMGLVETSVGIIPAWGGCRELLLRAQRTTSNPVPAQISKGVFDIILRAAKSSSALDARKLGYLAASDGISANRENLLADAKLKALTLADCYQPPLPENLILPGPSAVAALTMSLESSVRSGAASGDDLAVGVALAHAVTGGDNANMTTPCSESLVLDLECAGFMQLARSEKTRERMNLVLSGRI